jgi:WD40 repeat protein
LRENGGWITSVAVTPDGQYAISASAYRTLRASVFGWPNPERQSKEPNSSSAAASSERKWNDFSLSSPNVARPAVWNLRTGQFVHALEGHTDLVNAVAVTADSHRAISASADHSLRIWDLETGDCIAAFSGDGPMLRCSIAPDGRTIIARDKSGRVHVLQLEGLEWASLA